MMQSKTLFGGAKEDFLKIFAATIAIFLLSFSPTLSNSAITIFIVVYLLDGGHVYSTFVEVLLDPVEARKRYVWAMTLGAFFLNLAILLLVPQLFYYYIFYFTVFHNMRQGLGVTFLYKRGDKVGMSFYKFSYYFLTIIPFLLFHFRGRDSQFRLSDAIIKSVDLRQFFSADYLQTAYIYGLRFYLMGVVLIFSWIAFKKMWGGFLSMFFFCAVYAFSFLISKHEFQSYMILIVSHAIPYFFLMEKRVSKTHSIHFIKRYAGWWLLLFFALGGLLDYNHENLIESFEQVDILMRAILLTPLIAHFLLDAVLWKRQNERFQIFISS